MIVVLRESVWNDSDEHSSYYLDSTVGISIGVRTSGNRRSVDEATTLSFRGQTRSASGTEADVDGTTRGMTEKALQDVEGTQHSVM